MNEQKNLAGNIFYNTYGTFFYFFCQWLITVLVVRISGYEDAGVLSIVISTTNIFHCISLFGVRNYQVSDVQKKYTDSEFIYTRILTTSLGLLTFIIALFFLDFSHKTLVCGLAYMLYKCCESFSDVYFGTFQRYNSYKAIAISFTLKGMLTVVTFAGTLYLTNDLLSTIMINVLVYFLVLVIYDTRIINKITSIKFKFYNVSNIFKDCMPLMLFGLMVPYLNFITRFAIEKIYGIEVLGYYSSITMVFVVMSTLMGSIFVSIIPRIAIFYHDKNYNALKKIIKNMIFLLLIALIIICIGALLAGNFAFSLIFGKGILPYMYLLIPTIVASICLTLASFFSSILISFNENKKVLYGNIVSVLICTATVFIFIEKFELLGTLYSLIISLILSSVVLFVYIMRNLKKEM